MRRELFLLAAIPVTITTIVFLWFALPYMPLVIQLVGVAILVVGCAAGYHLWEDKRLDREKKRAEVRALTRQEREFEQRVHAAMMVIAHGGSMQYGDFQASVLYPTRTLPETRIIEAEQSLLPSPQMELPQAPDFHRMKHLISPSRIILTYTAQGPVYGEITDLLSMALVGKPKRGKTTALMYYLCILLMAGAEVWIWDPHGEMYALAYGLNYYHDLEEIACTSVPLLQRELIEWDHLYKHEQKRVKHPLVLLVDELPVIAKWDQDQRKAKRSVSSPMDMMQRFTLEARKWNCYVFISGQSLPASVLPTLTRDNLSSRLVLECSKDHARMVGLERDVIDTMLPYLRGADKGTHIADFSFWSKPELADIPYTTTDDLRTIIDERENGNGNAVSNLETAWQAPSSNAFPFPARETEPSVEAVPLVGNEVKETIRRMHAKKMPLRDIAPLVGLSGGKYHIFKQVCQELGITQVEQEA